MKPKNRNRRSLNKSKPLTCEARSTKELHISNMTKRLIESAELIKHVLPKHCRMGHEWKKPGLEQL